MVVPRLGHGLVVAAALAVLVMPAGAVGGASTPGVTVSTGGSVDVDEIGPTTDTYTIVLDTQPSADVQITVTADADTEVSKGGTFSSSVDLTFTDTNWSTPQVITVRAIDDAIDEVTPQASTITHSASSGDTDYDGIAIANVTAQVTDNDAAGVAITQSGGSMDVDETGPTTDTYTIGITSQPSSTLTITVTADAQTRVSTNGVIFQAAVDLTFTSANWSTPQSVTVAAVDDSVDEGALHNGTITHSASGASEYVPILLPNVVANITDNDTSGVILTPTTVDVTEGGVTDTYTIVLDSQPTSAVTISFTTGTQLQPIANVTFTAANWQIAKTITVIAVDDGFVEGAHGGTISHGVVSTDANYNGLTVSDVSANITDNDTAAVIVSPTTVEVTDDGVTDTYTIVLDSQPTSDVTISFDPGPGLQPIAAVTFTPADWNMPQTITVAVVNDEDVEGAHSATIQHTASSADPNYDGITVSDVTANITDDEPALAQIAALKAEIGAAALNPGLKNQLTGGLNQAEQALERNPPRTAEACRKLGSLIDKLKKNSGRKGLTAGQAAVWIANASDIKSALGCATT